jgi:hypothetical protein
MPSRHPTRARPLHATPSKPLLIGTSCLEWYPPTRASSAEFPKCDVELLSVIALSQ